MTNIPLIQGNSVQEINTSIIAIKKAQKELETLNTQIDNKIKALNLALSGGPGKYIESIQEVQGLIKVTEGSITDTIASGNTQPATSDGVYKSIKLIDVNEDYLFIDGKCLGTKVDVKNRASTEINSWQPLLSVLYKDGKWNTFGFFKNLPILANDIEQSYAVLSDYNLPIRIIKKTITGTTNVNGVLYSGNSNLDGLEIILNAVVTSANDYKVVVGRNAQDGQWLQIYKYNNTLIANTQVTLEIIYFSQ